MKPPLRRSAPSLGTVAAACLAAGTAAAADTVKLTPDDYVAIQQLDAQYAFAIETCTNKGYDYADLYVPEGEFGIAPDWGQHPQKTLKGRDALANADCGGPGGCRDPKTFIGYGLSHIIADTVITPTPTGATSKEILLVVGVGGEPTAIESQGGYESTYIKPPAGWRYVTRWHVFPNMAASVQFGHQTPVARPAPVEQPLTEGVDPKWLVPPVSTRSSLTPQDYIDIEQLSARYAFAVDHCSNNGYDYADLYTEDGEFGVAPDWNAPPKRTIKGREALADIDGGGPGGCRDPKTLRGYGITHVILSPIIRPTATGAAGTAILLALGVGGNPNAIERQGGYQDVYVKTAKGWRIKTRWHVFPNMATSIQFGKPAHQGSAK
jgi:SnoaL-like domain